MQVWKRNLVKLIGKSFQKVEEKSCQIDHCAKSSDERSNGPNVLSNFQCLARAESLKSKILAKE